MSKIKSPLRFSRHFGVDPEHMRQLGAFDPALEADTPLFIDPILVKRSAAIELSEAGCARIDEHFENLYRLLAASNRTDDVCWNAAQRFLKFHEVPGTCLGYGGGSIHGSGWGSGLTGELLTRAKEIIDAGVEDPALFLLIGLFSPNIGPDRLSDMYTNILLPDLAAYSERICDSLGVPVEEFRIDNRDLFLPVNPSQLRRTPIVLVPRDVLRDLPIASSVEEIWEAAEHNQALRDAMNAHIGALWESANREQKEQTLRVLLRNPRYASSLLQQLMEAASEPYDLVNDPKGLLVWTDLAYEIGQSYPRQIAPPRDHNLDELDRVVKEIIGQFKHLMEDRDLWRVLHDSNSRKSEKTTQRLFYSVAYAYCKANGFDITPEADTGNGPVDFKFSNGQHPRILVELKLSKNDVQHGHDVQLPTYVRAEKADRAHYVVVDVGRLGRKWVNLVTTRRLANQTEPSIWLIDATPRESASTRSA